jgi:hypothetical protein
VQNGGAARLNGLSMRVVVLAEDVAQPLVEIAERPAQVLVADFWSIDGGRQPMRSARATMIPSGPRT